jgi:hypothetical protein
MILVQGHVGAQPVVTSYVNSKQISTINYRAHSLTVVSKSASTLYIQVFDSNNGVAGSVDVDGSSNPIPRYEIILPAGEQMSLTHSQFSTGLFVQAAPTQGNTTPDTTNSIKITSEGLPWPVSA